MKLIVTGGAGFIGSAVIRHVIRGTDAEVVDVDKLTYAATPEALEDCAESPRYAHVRADVADAAAMRAVFEAHDPDAVMHLAAESHVDRSIDGPADFVTTDVVGTCALLEAARRHWRALRGARAEDRRFPDGAPHDRLIEFVADRPGHDLRYAIDSARIRGELGWRPEESFESGLEGTVEWYLANEPWWRAIRAGRYDGRRLGIADGAA